MLARWREEVYRGAEHSCRVSDNPAARARFLFACAAGPYGKAAVVARQESKEAAGRRRYKTANVQPWKKDLDSSQLQKRGPSQKTLWTAILVGSPLRARNTRVRLNFLFLNNFPAMPNTTTLQPLRRFMPWATLALLFLGSGRSAPAQTAKNIPPKIFEPGG